MNKWGAIIKRLGIKTEWDGSIGCLTFFKKVAIPERATYTEEVPVNTRMPLSQIGGVILDRPISEVERKLRVELAAAFRIAQHLRWNLDTLNHITLRIADTDTFLMNPLGLAWEEITASSLVTLDFKGNIISHSGVRLRGPDLIFTAASSRRARTLIASCTRTNPLAP